MTNYHADEEFESSSKYFHRKSISRNITHPQSCVTWYRFPIKYSPIDSNASPVWGVEINSI